jgi:hypothetical protein
MSYRADDQAIVTGKAGPDGHFYHGGRGTPEKQSAAGADAADHEGRRLGVRRPLPSGFLDGRSVPHLRGARRVRLQRHRQVHRILPPARPPAHRRRIPARGRRGRSLRPGTAIHRRPGNPEVGQDHGRGGARIRENRARFRQHHGHHRAEGGGEGVPGKRGAFPLADGEHPERGGPARPRRWEATCWISSSRRRCGKGSRERSAR